MAPGEEALTCSRASYPILLGIRSEGSPLVPTPSSVPTFPQVLFYHEPASPYFLCLSSAGRSSITSSLFGPGEKVLRLVWDSRANNKMGPVSLTPIYSDTLCLSAGGFV